MGLGPIGKYSPSQKGGLAPSKKIQKKLDKGGSFHFPKDLGVHQFMMIFHKYEYKAEAASVAESIVLPMPQSLTDTYGMEYGAEDVGTLVAVGASAAANIIDSFQKAGTDAGKEKEATTKANMKPDEIAKDMASLGVAGVRTMAAKTMPQIEQAAALATGTIVNPHTALLFSKVNLKEFEFAWKLYPQDIEESNMLKNILRILKMRSHPTYMQKDNNYMMDYPHEVDLYYLGDGDSMHRFKRCAITGLNMNYSPEGSPAFFAGTGNPVFTELNIKFSETRIWTGEDFEDETVASGNMEPAAGGNG